MQNFKPCLFSRLKNLSRIICEYSYFFASPYQCSIVRKYSYTQKPAHLFQHRLRYSSKISHIKSKVTLDFKIWRVCIISERFYRQAVVSKSHHNIFCQARILSFLTYPIRRQSPNQTPCPASPGHIFHAVAVHHVNQNNSSCPSGSVFSFTCCLI